MPDRVVRDELLTSERYWGCSPEARNLFVSILLSADDLGRFTAANFALRTRCMAGTVNSERIEKLLAELVDVDLVRVYQHEGARYLFVPRFRQRLRYTTSKHPEPPAGISDLDEKKPVLALTVVGIEPDPSRQKRREVKRSEEKGREEVLTTANAVVAEADAPACPHAEIIALYHRLLPMGRQVNAELWKGTRQVHLRTRWKESPKRQTLDFWQRLFTYIADSEFLTGRTSPAPGRKPFELSLDWIVNPTNFAKIIEGAYNRG